MDSENLDQLLGEVTRRGGGLVLNNGEKPAAVVLSVDKYYQLLQGVPVLESALTTANMEQINQSKPSVLVTGGAGYIGAHVVRMLQKNGYTVGIIDNLSTGRRDHIPDGTTFFEGDVRDSAFLKHVFAEFPCQAVVHMAASLEVQESVEQPSPYAQNNIGSTMQLLASMHEAGVQNIVFSSTAAVYGEQETMPIAETAQAAPNNPYGHSKLIAEKIIKYYAQWAGMRATVLRYFNVCGTEPGWGIHDTHKNSHLIPIILEVANHEREKIIVNGGDYETHDGSCVRDYIHVSDIARAHVLAVERNTGDMFRVYNVGTGHGVSVKEMISSASEVTGRMVPMEIGPRRPGDAAITIADNKRITKELGFKAESSSLETIFQTSWDALRGAAAPEASTDSVSEQAPA